MNQENNSYGAKIERGVITSATGDGYMVKSYDREGIVTPIIKSIQDHQFSAGDRVYFFLFNDGCGKILCLMDE